MFFLQMSGVPGAGKSTLARVIAQKTGAVIIDHDIVKSALMESPIGAVPATTAGPLAYHIEWTMVDFHLAQGHSVILDSPCLYTEMLEKGAALSNKHQVPYKYIECALQDIQEIDHRLKTRARLISQNREVTSEAQFRQSFEKSKRPTDTSYLLIDSSRPLESYIDEVMAYLKQGTARNNKPESGHPKLDSCS